MIVRGRGYRRIADRLHLRYVTDHTGRTLRRTARLRKIRQGRAPTGLPCRCAHPDRSRDDAPVDEKACAVCGRRITWRKAWERDWERVRYCSTGCRRRGLRDSDAALETAIRELLAARARTATICPSEAARRIDPEGWRGLMEPARMAARRLVARGEVQIVQGGRVVDPSTAKGPIRIRRAR
jgi:hypothetical protein